jgi:uncharacterized protein DUF3592
MASLCPHCAHVLYGELCFPPYRTRAILALMKLPVDLETMVFVSPMLAVFSLWLIWNGLIGGEHARIVDNWPAVTGTVHESGQVALRSVSGTSNSSSTSYKVTIVYRYYVNKGEFNGRFEEITQSNPTANGLEARFKKGTHPQVYYNPASPEDSCIIRPSIWEHYFAVVIGFPLLIVSTVLFVFALRARKRKRGSVI